MDTMITDILDPDLAVDEFVEPVYRRALEDDPDAIFMMADYYWQGRMVGHDYDKAIALYRYVAMKGGVDAARTLGYIYGYGPNDIEIDFDESAKWYLMAARKGDAESQFEYGYYLYKGLGPDRSFPEAFDWLSLSAEQGNPQAMFYLGEMFRNGYGVDFSLRSAVRMYRAAALKDEPLAQLNLARMYMEGDGAGLDEDKALFWFGKVCEETPIHMGFMYEEGFPMIRNIDDAVWWYRFSADTGDPNGLCNLGNLYCQGEGVEQDYGMALDLINRSLEKDYGPGYRVMGEMYEEGLGVEQDLAMAIEMYKRAAEAGYEVAEKELERLLPSHRDSGGPR